MVLMYADPRHPIICMYIYIIIIYYYYTYNYYYYTYILYKCIVGKKDAFNQKGSFVNGPSP